MACLILAISMNSCAQTSEKPATPTTIKTSPNTTLPPHTYTYTPTAKSKSTTAKSAATKTATTVKTVATGKTGTSPTPAPSSTVSQTQSGKTSTTSTNTPTPSSNTTSGTSTQNSSGTGKTKMGSGSSTTTTGSGTGNTQNSTGNILTTVLGGSSGSFTESDAASAIKEALMKGVTAGVNKVSVTDGYFKNNMIKIPFPQDAKVVETTLRSAGMGSMIDNLVLSLNRAAESAANQAGPIFVNGIKQMTITDAMNIVGNQQPDAATKFLQRTTTESLVTAFKPPIKTALDKTLATKYWNDIMTYYNKIPFVKKVNPDLNDFVTRKAISGLFYMIGQEEAKIRKDPLGQGSKIIETVFGSVLKR